LLRTAALFTAGLATTATASMASSSIRPRRSGERGSADHGWLKSRFTFSFAEFHDPRFESFGPLRVLNDDTVAAGGGFPTHPHANFEIWSYILSGGLKHNDSMGNSEVLGRGHVQFTSAGTGIRLSEFNADARAGGTPVRFLQIWAQPNKRGLKPSYQTGFFAEERKLDALCPILAPEGAPGAPPAEAGSALTIHQDLRMHASLLRAGSAVRLPLPAGRLAYLHIPIMPGGAGVAVSLPGAAPVELAMGDGAFIEWGGPGEGALEVVGLGAAAVAAGGGGGGGTTTTTEFILMDFARA
jgi:redox-sensitive bicupin YhaK (pirin superfamily)